MAAKKKHLLVTIDDASHARMDEVVRRLKAAGLSNVRPMESIGIVSGQAPEAKIAAIRKVRGVRAVEESAWIQLPPPDSPIQ